MLLLKIVKNVLPIVLIVLMLRNAMYAWIWMGSTWTEGNVLLVQMDVKHVHQEQNAQNVVQDFLLLRIVNVNKRLVLQASS